MLLNDSYIAFINLDSRQDRLAHMTTQLDRVEITAERVRGLLPSEVKVDSRKVAVMQKRTPGAIGCHYSQVSIMEKALELGKHAFVLEDDLIFCEDFQARIQYIDTFLEPREWDVFWLGGTFHSPAWWHKQGHDRELPQCKCNLRKDVEITNWSRWSRIVRTYGAFCTYAYIVNIKSLDKILKLLDENVALSMGIDWLFIYLQPQLKTYAFVPGCIKQMDGLSDIGLTADKKPGFTTFSGFLSLNGTLENSSYVYQERMGDFDPLTYVWK